MTSAEQAKEIAAGLEDLERYIRERFPNQVELSLDNHGHLDRKIHPVPGLSRTGERYQELPTGEPNFIFAGYQTLAEALAAMRACFDRYAADKRGTLYWRTKPEVDFSPGRGWIFYLRLLISDKPVKEV